MPTNETSTAVTRSSSGLRRWEAQVRLLLTRTAGQIGAARWILKEGCVLELHGGDVPPAILCARLIQNKELFREMRNSPAGGFRVEYRDRFGQLNPLLYLMNGEIEFIYASVDEKPCVDHRARTCRPRRAHLDYESGPVEITLETARATLDKPCGTRYRIGRDLDQDIRLADPCVSRRHAEIYSGHLSKIQRQQYFIEDVDSSNGTFINDRKLKPRNPHRLKAGDRIRIGETNLAFSFAKAGNRSRRKPATYRKGKKIQTNVPG